MLILSGAVGPARDGAGRQGAIGGGRRGGCGLVPRVGGAVLVLPFLVSDISPVFAEPVPQFQQGLPAHVNPVYLEPGLPEFQFPTGGGGGGGGPGDTGGGGNRGNTRSGDLGGIGRNRLLAYEWGADALTASEELGVYGSALGATCVLEGCKNVRGPGGGTISGWFQMRDDTFLESVRAAVRENPSLAGRLVPGLAGKNDPVTQSIAAAQYLKQGAESLQRAGISNPRVLDVRPYYQFGPGYAIPVASALDSDNLRTVLAGTSEATFRANGISPTMTVGEWRQKVVKVVGSGAYQTVLR